jgi:hypothetical protein
VSSEDYDRRFYGLYPGKCIDINDPERRSRIKITVPQITGEAVSTWALPCRTPGISNGTPTAADKSVPATGAVVWVMFVGGDPNFPVWIGVL